MTMKTVSIAVLAALAIAGCAQTGSQQQPQQQAAAPAPKAAPGMNERGEVVDSSKVSSGYGRKVTGRGNWQGEITGKPAPNSKFSKLEIGMSMREATDLAGQPSDSGAYVTGKAWIPFYFGSDRHRYELVYKGHGRLIFAGGSVANYTGGNLIWIIHNANEPGYR